MMQLNMNGNIRLLANSLFRVTPAYIIVARIANGEARTAVVSAKQKIVQLTIEILHRRRVVPLVMTR